MSDYLVAALYKFVSLPNYESLREPLIDFCQSRQIKGTLLLAAEGINGTVAGTPEAIQALLEELRQQPGLDGLEHKESVATEQPFYRLKIKLKKEIVTMGVEGIDPNLVVGTYVAPAEWNALISDPDVTVVDTRNDYEYEIGTFRGAVNPNTQSFRQLPQYVAENLDPNTHKKVAMFCTGGIRCEKSTALMKQMGFEEVYHLQGGILKYLEEVPEGNSLWDGECFVFDNRVSVKHGLEEGSYELCHGCRFPINEADKRSDKYIKGVACPRCYDEQTPEQRSRFLERQKQMELASRKGELHIGDRADIAKSRTTQGTPSADGE